MHFNILFSINTVFSATLDLNNKNSIRDANNKVANVLMTYWNEAKADGSAYHGSFKESSNSDKSVNGWNWYESGILWGAIMDYTKVTGDQRYAETAVQSLTVASFNSAGSFLGPKGTRLWSEAVNGKWNDDIGWWVMGAVTGMEIYGPDVNMAGGVSYETLSKNTLEEMLEQWDSSSICPGGLYWSRNRLSKDDQIKNYKSAISNAQALMIAARIIKVDPKQNEKYISRANQIAEWLDSITPSNNLVHDGVLVTDGPKCMLAQNHQSYTAGMTAGALASFYEISKDPKHLAQAEGIGSRSIQIFQNNGIITDTCEPIRKPKTTCQLNGVTPKGTFIRGMLELYRVSTNEDFKTKFKTLVINSVNAILPLCDDNFVCNSEYWSAGTVAKERNVHAQLNALELFNALTVVSEAHVSDAKFVAPTTKPESEGFRWDAVPLSTYIILFVVFILLVITSCVCFFFIRKRRRNIEAQRARAFAQSMIFQKKEFIDLAAVNPVSEKTSNNDYVYQYSDYSSQSQTTIDNAKIQSDFDL